MFYFLFRTNFLMYHINFLLLAKSVKELRRKISFAFAEKYDKKYDWHINI
jgi:hypothetical protein